MKSRMLLACGCAVLLAAGCSAGWQSRGVKSAESPVVVYAEGHMTQVEIDAVGRIFRDGDTARKAEEVQRRTTSVLFERGGSLTPTSQPAPVPASTAKSSDGYITKIVIVGSGEARDESPAKAVVRAVSPFGKGAGETLTSEAGGETEITVPAPPSVSKFGVHVEAEEDEEDDLILTSIKPSGEKPSPSVVVEDKGNAPSWIEQTWNGAKTIVFVAVIVAVIWLVLSLLPQTAPYLAPINTWIWNKLRPSTAADAPQEPTDDKAD